MINHKNINKSTITTDLDIFMYYPIDGKTQ